MEPTNEERAQRGMDALETYAPDTVLGDEDDLRAAAVDLMTDLLHCIARYGRDPESAHAITWRHYIAEVAAHDVRRTS